MKRTWKPPTPLDMVCPDRRANLPRGTEWHRCAPSALQARRMFREGDVVELSEVGRRSLRERRAFRATVVAFSADGLAVWVRRDGSQSSACYSPDFLRPATLSEHPNE